jgi:hypothetical protein
VRSSADRYFPSLTFLRATLYSPLAFGHDVESSQASMDHWLWSLL